MMLIYCIDWGIQVPMVFEVPWAILTREGSFPKGGDDHDRGDGFRTGLSRGRR